jgi:tetratricopeptide (TPR) repeat protein
LLLFWVLYGFYLAAYIDFDGDVCRALSAQILSLAEKQSTMTGPRLLAHRVMGTSLLHVGDIVSARAHFDRSIGYFSPNERLGSRFALERVVALAYRAMTLWLLGYPGAALSDVDHAINDVREMGQAGPLMIVLTLAGVTVMLCGHEASARALFDEVIDLADEKRAVFWREYGLLNKGCLLAIAGEADDAIRTITAALAALQETERVWRPWHLSNLSGLMDLLANWIMPGAALAKPTQ